MLTSPPRYVKGQRVLLDYNEEAPLKGTIVNVFPRPTNHIYQCTVDGARQGYFEHGSTWFEYEIQPLEEQCLSDS